MSKLEKIQAALENGGVTDALLAIQAEDGYISEPALRALAEQIGISAAELYDTASFYSMLRFTAPAKKIVRICRGTACHSGCNIALAEAIEKITGGKMGEISPDGEYDLGWVECLGQCQTAPNILIDGKLYTAADIKELETLLKKGGA